MMSSSERSLVTAQGFELDLDGDGNVTGTPSNELQVDALIWAFKLMVLPDSAIRATLTQIAPVTVTVYCGTGAV